LGWLWPAFVISLAGAVICGWRLRQRVRRNCGSTEMRYSPGMVLRATGVGSGGLDVDLAIKARHVYQRDGGDWVEYAAASGDERWWIQIATRNPSTVILIRACGRWPNAEKLLNGGGIEDLLDRRDLVVGDNEYSVLATGRAKLMHYGDAARVERFRFVELVHRHRGDCFLVFEDRGAGPLSAYEATAIPAQSLRRLEAEQGESGVG